MQKKKNELDEIRKEWYKKLKEEKFKDIETVFKRNGEVRVSTDGGGYYGKDTNGSKARDYAEKFSKRRLKRIVFNEKIKEYIYANEELLTPLDFYILELYSDYVSLRSIACIVKKEKKFKRCYHYYYLRIKEHTPKILAFHDFGAMHV